MLTIPAYDGYALTATAFVPDEAPRAIVVVLGGTAIRATHYRRFAAYLKDSGLAVITFDYRGVGASRPEGSLAALDATMKDWALEDARGVLRWARHTYPGVPLVAVGHSFGAQAIGLLDELREVDAMVTVAGQLGWYGHWPLGAQLRLGLMWHVIAPAVSGALGYYPGVLGLGGVDLPRGVATEWARWCRSRHYFVDHEPSAHARFEAFDRPTLMWSFTDDDFAPEGAVRAFETALASAPRTHVRLDPAAVGLSRIGHFGFFGEPMQPAWDRVVRFVDEVREGRWEPAPAAPTTPTLFTVEDVMADLTYGQA